MRVTRTTGDMTYQADCDNGTRWHVGASVIKDSDGTSTNSRHHPVMNEIGDGWTWLKEYTSAAVWWIHESGLHVRLNTCFNGAWENRDIHESLAAELRHAVVSGATGYHEIMVDNNNVKLVKR